MKCSNTDYSRVDLGIRTVLALSFAVLATVYFANSALQLRSLSFSNIDMHLLGRSLSTLAIAFFTFTIACLYILRLRPVGAAEGILPRLAAILGGFLLFALLLLTPNADLPLGLQLTSCFLTFLGNSLAIYVLFHLGRSFSIFPEGRKLVTSGPYRVVRHPLYLAEAVATIGVLIHFLSFWAVVLVTVQMAMQLVRIHYEEKLLDEVFPDHYSNYVQRTWRLVPGVY